MPLDQQFEMIKDDCFYTLLSQEYVYFLHYAADIEQNLTIQYIISEYLMSCLQSMRQPFLTCDLFENVFEKYFKKAMFLKAFNKENFDVVYRMYTYNVLFKEESNYTTFNYVMLQYDVRADLLDRNGYRCFSEYEAENRERTETIATICFNNKHMQLVVKYGPY